MGPMKNNTIKSKHFVKSNESFEKNLKCDECEYSAFVKSTLNQHREAIHLLKKDFKCDECEYSTSQKSNLNKDIKTKHIQMNKEKKWKCHECEYCTLDKST